MIRCFVCQPPTEYPGTTYADFAAHYDTTHGHLIPVHQLEPVDWRTRAIDAVKRLAAARIEFTFYDVAKLAGEPLNPQSDWGRFAQDIAHMGLAHPIGWQHSDRPTTKSSAVRTWRGGSVPERNVA